MIKPLWRLIKTKEKEGMKMEKKLLTLLLSCCVSCSIISAGTVSAEESTQTLTETETEVETETEQPVSIDNFRGYKWGTSMDDIVADEIKNDMVDGVDYFFDDNMLVFTNGSVAGYDTLIVYEFDKSGKLIYGSYSLTEEHSNKTDYYDDFCDLAELYTEKYGQPISDKVDWKDDLYKDDPSDWGMAISVGHVKFYKIWEDPDGNYIGMTLSGDNYKIYTSILYGYAGYQAEKNMEGI